MSFMPKLSPQEQDELFQLYIAADKQSGIPVKEVLVQFGTTSSNLTIGSSTSFHRPVTKA
jgi:hypothetical protein